MKAILVAKLAPPVPSTSPTTSSSDPIPTEPFKDLRTIVPKIIHRRHKDSESKSFCADIQKLISDNTDQKSGTIDEISYRSRKDFEVNVNNKAFFAEQQKAWADLIKPLETKLTRDSAEQFLNNLFINLSALATYNIATPKSVLLFLSLKMNTYADEVEQTMAAKCLGIPIHIYYNKVDKEGLPFRYNPIIGSSPYSLNIFYDYYGPKNWRNHFSPVFITEAGDNIPKLVPVQMLVDLGLVESEEDGEMKRKHRNQFIDLAPKLISFPVGPADTSILNVDLSSLFTTESNSYTATVLSAASSSASLPARSSLHYSSIGALLFGGANAKELQSDGASGDSKEENQADKLSDDVVAMSELVKSDLDLAVLVHPRGASNHTYQVEGITNANVYAYQGTRK
jgi:hypothetical protein